MPVVEVFYLISGQLIQLKVMFAEKQKLVEDLEAYGPESGDKPAAGDPLPDPVSPVATAEPAAAEEPAAAAE